MTTLNSYLERLLNLFDERRRRFQVSSTLLLVGSLAYFFFVFYPYFTLLGNRLACQGQTARCSELEAALLNERFTEVTTSWGNIPISTAEFATLFPVILAFGFTAVTAQLVFLMRLRQAISQQIQRDQASVDLSLIAPLPIDPIRGNHNSIASGLVFMSPMGICLYAMRLIFLRRNVLQSQLPHAQGKGFYLFIYLLSILLLCISLLRLLFWLRSLAASAQPKQ